MSGKWRPFRLGFNVLITWFNITQYWMQHRSDLDLDILYHAIMSILCVVYCEDLLCYNSGMILDLYPAIERWCNFVTMSLIGWMQAYDHRADSRFAPSQWETALLCNDISYWLDASPKSALQLHCAVLCNKVSQVFWKHNPTWYVCTKQSKDEGST